LADLWIEPLPEPLPPSRNGVLKPRFVGGKTSCAKAFENDLFDTNVRALRKKGMQFEAEQFRTRGRRILEKRAAIEDEAIRKRYLALPLAKTLSPLESR
jgi:hypothetical protein